MKEYKRTERLTHIWVHPTFKNKLKVESAMNNMSILKYTEKLAKKKNLFGEEKNDKDEEPTFGFRF